MANEILKCDGTDPVYIPNWDNVVGALTLSDGGMAGNLLTLARVHLEDSADKGELTEENVGQVYSAAIVESMKSAIMFELSKGKAQVEICLLKENIAKSQCECENDTNRTDSTISLNAAQENKLACDCCNASRQTDLQKIKNDCECANDSSRTYTQRYSAECECNNKSKSTDGQISKWECDCANSEFNADTQRTKAECDCANSSALATQQAALYGAQAAGFDDNAKQKLYETQMAAWSMVFADTSLDVVTSSIAEDEITSVYSNLKSSVGVS